MRYKVFFFFKQKTAYEIYQCDWSSDVCSSDLDPLIDSRRYSEGFTRNFIVPQIAPTAIQDLVDRFHRNIEAYRTQGYNETQLRREFLDPFLEALGWDVDRKSVV